jgi:hypothetical protein
LLRRACAKLRLETTGAEGAFDGERPKQAQGQTNGIVETDDMTTATHYQPERTRGGEQWRSLNCRNPKDGITERNEVELTAWNCGGDLGYDPLGIATVFSIQSQLFTEYEVHRFYLYLWAVPYHLPALAIIIYIIIHLFKTLDNIKISCLVFSF